jgi:hypothetical protein
MGHYRLLGLSSAIVGASSLVGLFGSFFLLSILLLLLLLWTMARMSVLISLRASELIRCMCSDKLVLFFSVTFENMQQVSFLGQECPRTADRVFPNQRRQVNSGDCVQDRLNQCLNSVCVEDFILDYHVRKGSEFFDLLLELLEGGSAGLYILQQCPNSSTERSELDSGADNTKHFSHNIYPALSTSTNTTAVFVKDAKNFQRIAKTRCLG